MNEAIERAHCDGLLTTTSLMVGAAAADDAVRRARALPSLRVGLHLVLVCGRSVLPPAEIPDLADSDGRFSSRLVRAGFRFFFVPRVRRQLVAEIRAQFERFRQTGLALDHVNAHNHMHLHPTVFRMVTEIGMDYGLAAVRIPHEPFLPSWRAAREGLLRRLANDVCLRPLIALHRRHLARKGLRSNDYVFGMNDSGGVDRTRLQGFLANLPRGVSEIYCHPATAPWPDMEPEARHYRVEEELAALTDETLAAMLPRHGIEATTYGALSATGRNP